MNNIGQERYHCRLVEVDDIPLLCQIYNDQIDDKCQLIAVDKVEPQLFEKYIQSIQLNDYPVWAYFYQNKMVAWAVIQPWALVMTAAARTAEFSVYLDKKWHKSSIALHSILLCFELAIRKQIKYLIFSVLKNNHPSRILFSHFPVIKCASFDDMIEINKQTLTLEMYRACLHDKDLQNVIVQLRQKFGRKIKTWELIGMTC